MGKLLWVYSYELSPPQSHRRLEEVQRILDQENAKARAGGRTWTGRLVEEKRVSHILIVSDTHLQDSSVNSRLQDALQKIEASATLTVPMPVTPKAPPPRHGHHRPT